jgi:hypothetical protein
MKIDPMGLGHYHEKWIVLRIKQWTLEQAALNILLLLKEFLFANN